MTIKLSSEQRLVLQRMATGQKLLRGYVYAYRLIGNGEFESSVPNASSVRGLMMRQLIVWGTDGYELSVTGREAAR